MVHVVSILATRASLGLSDLVAFAQRQAALADLIELRLDHCTHWTETQLRELFDAIGKPVIVAVHCPKAFGFFAGSDEERLEFLHTAARAGARFVDIDWTLSLALGEVCAPCHRIVSRHDTQGTPADLGAFEEDVRALLYEGDVIKLVTHANRCEDGLRMMRHLRAAPGGLIAFCSGARGSFTRVLAPIFGSPFTYCSPASSSDTSTSPEAHSASAPGQIPIDELLGLLPPGGVGPQTGVLGVVGRPIVHSLSPRVHSMACKRAGFDAVYLAFEPDDFDTFLDLADDPVYRGFSITAPFKQSACARADSTEVDARVISAVNTLVRAGEGWRGINTDTGAIQATLESALPLLSRRATHALVLGAGGAAKAAVQALMRMGLDVCVAARRSEASATLAQAAGCTSVAWAQIPTSPCDVLVHCTPVGTQPVGTDSMGAAGSDGTVAPIPADWIRPGSLVLDAVYRPVRTQLLLDAAAQGAHAIPGAEWFHRQAVAQFEAFTGLQPDEELMRATLAGALGIKLDGMSPP